MERRKERLRELLKQEIANLILYHLKDPRLKEVVVTRIELSPDMKDMTVYYTTLTEGEEEKIQKALEQAKGFIRHQLMKSLDIKYVPNMRFKFDKELKQMERLWEKMS
ncbi:ribosome-binding factor A [Thermocrinis albus DSM 14484]|uniref:Ribosome-binding factor A n=1 Tax=Thermocrinis albus (strain DSM 14484 / JCM 11386 / HI 11/12) TaxID=638303 RepID=D3SMI5_THEAH|nr:30S ribosome-binding factor RbfA [Thermocrinis albus]ADC89965.1 ribosome-binding factor A [Thermocrinis albus DSM 14484]